MNQIEVITACQQLADHQQYELGQNLYAIMADDSNLDRIKQITHKGHVGKWVVVFGKANGFGYEKFLVNDATGKVSWITGPVSWWLWLLLCPIYLFWIFVIFIGSVIALPCERAWKHFWLPHCTTCGKKLRTPWAKQCFSCGNEWHSR